MYRASGPQLVQKYCKEIESKTKSARVNIYIQWNPEVVNFHIAGLEEGIRRAVEQIREEFLPQEVYKFRVEYGSIVVILLRFPTV